MLPYDKKRDRLAIESQAKALWDDYLKGQVESGDRKSRRKWSRNKTGSDKKGGKKYYAGDNPEYPSDRDEYGAYQFW